MNSPKRDWHVFPSAITNVVMKKHHIFALLPLLFTAAQPAVAEQVRQQPTAVLELFTSQGCSSCPPADALLSEYDEREDIIALAYHVDYWDYIGWQDTFASAENSNFQRAYAKAQDKNRIYTPQLMINGSKDVVGSRRGDTDAAILSANLTIPVDLQFSDGMLKVEIDGNTALGEAKVWLVTYKSTAEVAIDRGENRGQTLNYYQIVTNRQVLGMWEPTDGAQVKLPLDDMLGAESDGLAVIVQADLNGLPGPILGAASFER